MLQMELSCGLVCVGLTLWWWYLLPVSITMHIRHCIMWLEFALDSLISASPFKLQPIVRFSPWSSTSLSRVSAINLEDRINLDNTEDFSREHFYCFWGFHGIWDCCVSWFPYLGHPLFGSRNPIINWKLEVPGERGHILHVRLLDSDRGPWLLRSTYLRSWVRLFRRELNPVCVWKLRVNAEIWPCLGPRLSLHE